MDQLGRQPEAGHRGNPHGLGVDLDHLKFTEFRKANLPSFRGAYDPNKADEWIKAMEKSFFCLGLLGPSKGDLCHLYARSRCRVLVEQCTKTTRRMSDGSHLDGVQRCFLPKVLSCFSSKCQRVRIYAASLGK